MNFYTKDGDVRLQSCRDNLFLCGNFYNKNYQLLLYTSKILFGMEKVYKHPTQKADHIVIVSYFRDIMLLTNHGWEDKRKIEKKKKTSKIKSAMFMQSKWKDSMIKIQFIVTNEQINMGKVITTSNGGDFTPVRMFKAKILNVLSTWNQTQSHPGRSRVPITSFYPKF